MGANGWNPKHTRKGMWLIDVEGFFVVMLNIRKDFIPCAWMFGIVHAQDMDNHHVDYLCLSISLWVEGSRFS
jgi:hypothetical protein